MREFLVEGFGAWPFRSWFPVTPMHEFHHVVEGGAGKKNFVYAFASHHCGVLVRDGAAAAPENLDIVCAFFSQKIGNCREKFDVPAVVTRDANRPHVFLDGGTADVANRAVVP